MRSDPRFIELMEKTGLQHGRIFPHENRAKMRDPYPLDEFYTTEARERVYGLGGWECEVYGYRYEQ